MNGQGLEMTKSKSVVTPPSEEIHMNGENAEYGEDDGKLIIDSNGGSSNETGNETESSEGVSTNPGSNEAPRTPERECFMDQDDAVMMNGSFHISPVA